MAIQFPANPQIGQVYAAGGSVWSWTGVKWRITTTTSSNLVAVSNHILPTANVAYDLGNVNLRWRDLYLSGNTLNLGSTAIKSTANLVTFTSAANANTAVSLSVNSLTLGTGANAITLISGNTGLQTLSSNNTITPIAGSGVGTSVTASSAAPQSPTVGSLWFDTETGELAAFYANTWLVGGDGVSGATGAT